MNPRRSTVTQIRVQDHACEPLNIACFKLALLRTSET